MYPLSMLYSMLALNETIPTEHCLEPGSYTFDTFDNRLDHPGRDICFGNPIAPYLYPSDNTSRWRFDAPFSNIGFRLLVNNFSLPESVNDECVDYLMFNGINTTVDNTTFCGTKGFELNSSWSSGTELDIDFYSSETHPPSDERENYKFFIHISTYGICNGTINVPDNGTVYFAFNSSVELYQNAGHLFSCIWNISGPANYNALDVKVDVCTSDGLKFFYHTEDGVGVIANPCDDPPLKQYRTNQMMAELQMSSPGDFVEFSMTIRATNSSNTTSTFEPTWPTSSSTGTQTTQFATTGFTSGPPPTTSPPPVTPMTSATTAAPPITSVSTETTMEFHSANDSTTSNSDEFTTTIKTETTTKTTLPGVDKTSPTFIPTVYSITSEKPAPILDTSSTPAPGIDPVMTHIPGGVTEDVGLSNDRVLVIIGVTITGLLFLVGVFCICRYRRKWLVMVDELKAKCNQMGWQQSTSTAPVYIPLPKECEPYIIHPRQLKKSETFLGKGEHGLVYKGSALGLLGKNGATDVAVKTLLASGSTANPASMAKFVKEVTIMLQTGQHLNLVNLLGVIDRGRPCMLLEYCEHGNLLSYLRDCHSSHLYDPSELTISSYLEINVEKVDLNNHPGQRVFDTSELIKFAYQIARGMQYLASRSIVHRDLAARNVLVAQHNILKISDFGMAKQIESVYVAQDSSAALPIRWMPPEAITTLSFSLASDVWSYGIVLWEIFTQGKVPYVEIAITGQIKVFNQWLLDGNILSKPADTPDTIYQLMKACWNLHPEKRPSFSDIRKYLDKSISKQAVASYLQLDAPYEYMNLVNQEMHIKLYQSTQTDTVL